MAKYDDPYTSSYTYTWDSSTGPVYVSSPEPFPFTTVNPIPGQTVTVLDTPCVVCGVDLEEDTFLCSLCKQALLQVRKNYVAETIQILLDEERNENVRLHQGFTASGKLTHAVRLIRRGEYQPRAICGVRIETAKARKFDAAERGAACSRCLGSLGTE